MENTKIGSQKIMIIILQTQKLFRKLKKNSTIFKLNPLLEVGAMIVKESSQSFIRSWSWLGLILKMILK